MSENEGVSLAPSRFRVVGVSGSGKSTFARALAARSGLPRLELDAVFWDANWTYRDLDDALRIVREFAARHPDGWVVDGNWTNRMNGLLETDTECGADLEVWLDYRRSTVMRRVVSRTVRRGILRQELWHGNRERPSSWVKRDPQENIVLWAWTSYPRVRERMVARIAAGESIVRLRSQREADEWLATVAPVSAD